MIDIVSLYNELSELGYSEQQAHLSKLKKIDLIKANELEKMLKVDDITISTTEFLSEQISTSTAASKHSFIGQEVMGFTIKSLLSESGGMGLVYHAEQDIFCSNHTQNQSHKAAIKILRSDKLNSEQQKVMFFNEASSLMLLDHPNICSLYGVSEVLDHACIVMDYIDGQSLDIWLALNKPTNKQKFNVFIQLLNAVCYLHELQIYHGDLKPQNIIINDQEHLVLIDLGLAQKFKSVEMHDNKNTVKAFSKNWSAPEQIAGYPYEAMSDVYSLGAIMCYLLTDKPPSQTSRSYIKDKELNALLNKALASAPENRFQDANQLRLKIQQYQQGFPIDEYSTHPIYQFKKLITRKPFTSLTCVLLLYSVASSVLLFVK
ncbi:serine/threonine-protein kinase [Psychromonas hadalis]|uniref:serine/threonine-protein kinase n=1 Tax=Psychromonas hadalis TaxID=211669 RepID=UPI0003B2F2B3|nr:serine/threonine-protein kinase [Psychromonas hadalis]